MEERRMGAGARKLAAQRAVEREEKAPEKSPRRWSPKPEREIRQVNFKLPVDLMDRLEAQAKRKRTTMTNIIEELLEDYLGVICEECGGAGVVAK